MPQKTLELAGRYFVDKFVEKFGTEDTDKDALAWPEWKFKLRNHLATVDPAFVVDMETVDRDRNEELDIALATNELQGWAVMLYSLLGKAVKAAAVGFC